MKNTVPYKQQIMSLLTQKGAYITAADCRRIGIPSIYLTQLVREGSIHRVGRGVYASAPLAHDEEFIFQSRNKRCIFSYHSALSLHGLTDRLPGRMDVTVYRGYNAHRIPEHVRVHYVNKDIYPLGITQAQTVFGNPVNAYDRERTLCDLIKNRADIEGEVFSQALRNYVRHPEKDLPKLFDYAARMKILQATQELLEVLIE